MILQKKRFAGILLAITLILLVPFIAMQLTTEVQWSLPDFAIAAVLLLGAGLLIEFTLQKVKTTRNRIVICVLILFMLFLIWAELAVGIFGTPFAGS